MIYIDELKDLKLYRKSFVLPRNGMDKRKNNMVFLLTPNYTSSINLINHPLMVNKYYKSYYLEKDVSLYINNEGYFTRINNEKYIHENSEENVELNINEGYFSNNKSSSALVYNGLETDVFTVKNYINISRIEYLNTDLNARFDYPISVTVYRKEFHVESTANTINVASERFYDGIDYKYYCDEEIYTMILKTINPNVNQYVLECAVMVLAGTYDTYNDEISKYYYAGCEVFKNILSEPNGRKKLAKIIKKNGVKDFKTLFNLDLQLFKSITESSLTPIQKLKRSITYKSRKGSKHILNRIENKIEKVADPTQSNPEFTTNNDLDKTPDKTEIDVPVIDVNKRFDPNSNQESQEEAFDIGISHIPQIPINEDYIMTENVITYFNEDSYNYTTELRRLLYKERIRTNKEMINIYDKVKLDCPQIQYTYLNYQRYKCMNIFIDLYYYNDLFFRNNMYKYQKGTDLYFTFLNNLLNNKKLDNAGYNGKKIVFIPVLDWTENPNTKMWLYTQDINPVSIIYRKMTTDFNSLKKLFKDMDVVFITDKMYFKMNFSKCKDDCSATFLTLIRKLLINNDQNIETQDDIDEKDSYQTRVNSIIDSIEDNKNVKISHLTGKDTINASGDDSGNSGNSGNDKEIIVKKIEDAAEKTTSIEDAMEELDKDEEFKKLLLALNDEEDNSIKINNARMSRISKLNDEFLEKEVKGKKVKDILESRERFNDEKLTPVALPIESINPEWGALTYPSLSKQYDPDADIIAMLNSFSTKTYPLSIRDITIEDNSTSEDFIYTYTVDMESHIGKRFKLRFDIPKLENGQYMRLRGNNKCISSQSFLMPILKTDIDTVQMISNYSKIFIRRYNVATGKSNKFTNLIIKTLTKNNYKGVIVVTGNNELVCNKYELPIDYIDLSSVFTRIDILTNGTSIYFNQDEFIKEVEARKLKLDSNKGLGYGFDKDGILYYKYDEEVGRTFSQALYYDLAADPELMKDLFETKFAPTRYTYSQASIMATKIPLIVLAAYSEGLTKVLDKAHIKYEMMESIKDIKGNITKDYIKFSDGYLVYDYSYASSLLLNGLLECDTEDYSITDINKKSMYLDFLDDFGGRIKADGFDNFYDCFVDVITESTLQYYNLPTDYVELLMYANSLLADNKYISHGEMGARRLRRNELIAGYTYKALAGAYGAYMTSFKHGRETIMSMKQSAIIDLIMIDPTFNDLSTINALNEKESYDMVTPKGLSGMNSERSFSLDKRSYDESMINILGMSTAFAGTVGINRQATINASVDTVRGYVKPSTLEDMNSVNTMCMSEALSPFGPTRDDPFRTAMTFIQTTRHTMRTTKSDPSLVTTGADEALPYLISNMFAFKAKGKGKVVELVDDDYMIIAYADGTNDYVDLSESIEKNSASGFYVPLKLSTDLKEGSTVKEGQIVAYDKSSFDPSIGLDNNIAYNMGTLVYCAYLTTDESFEDSASISGRLTKAMASDVIVKKEITIPKTTNIYNLLPVGTPVEEGQTLMVMQSAFDEEDANLLLKNLAADEEEITDLGRIPIKSKITGIVQDIDIYRTVELDELSESLQDICKKYEKNINKKEAVLKKYNIDNNGKLKPNYKLEATGKLKDTYDGIKIVFYLKYRDNMSVGDKLIYLNANKGVVKYIYPQGKEPYFISNPNEKLDTLVSIDSANARMVTSIQNMGVINYLLVEAARKAKQMAGISYKEDMFDFEVIEREMK